MAKAHEEKLRAVNEVENKYKKEIEDLKQKVEQLSSSSSSSSAAATTAAASKTSSNSYEFPATNKEMSAKVRAYQQFLSDYVIKSQLEKSKAVAAAEQKVKDRYEAIIQGMKE